MARCRIPLLSAPSVPGAHLLRQGSPSLPLGLGQNKGCSFPVFPTLSCSRKRDPAEPGREMHLEAHREQENSISRGIFLLVAVQCSACNSCCTLIYLWNDKFLGRHLCTLSSTIHRESCEHRRGHPRAHTAHATVHLHSQESRDNWRIGGIKELLPFSLSQIFGDFSSPCCRQKE